MTKPLTRRGFLKLFGASTLAGMAGTFGTFAYSTEIEPDWVDLHEVALALPRLAGAFDQYRIAHFTDLHLDDSLALKRVEEAVRLINAQKPDLVIITGDFFSRQPDLLDAGHRILQQLEAPDGVMAVLGNHDYWGGKVESIHQMLETTKIRVLRDAVVSLERQGRHLHIAGLDDLWQIHGPAKPLETYRPQLERLVAQVPADDAAMLLVHEPDMAMLASETGRFDLQLSGHSHGGQVKIPFGGAPIVPPLATQFPSGWYEVGTMQHYTNRGIGMIFPTVRFNCRPEIAIFKLTGRV